jgi:arylsulfatase A-like enzyme
VVAHGGRIEMPTMDRLASEGLTYSQWHTNALCSPRSCFLTGRNHHQNGFAQIAEGAQGFPGHTGMIPMENATVAEVLRENGWNTFWVGKNHNVPLDDWAMGGSKKHWPLARGFDRFYGFIGGEANQWYPTLVEDNHYVEHRKDLADKALSFIRDSKQSHPDKPWFMWFCPGANHAPHHAPQEYIDKYKGAFDAGYETCAGGTDRRPPGRVRPAGEHARHALRRQRRLRRRLARRLGQREQVLQRLSRRHRAEPRDAPETRVA